MTPAGPLGVVLAGGRSSRMGVDKAFVAVDGVALARRVADALLAGGCTRVRAQGGDAVRLGALGLDADPDDVEHAGPVAAIAAARQRHPGTLVVAACDLPDVSGGVIAGLLTRCVETGAPVVAVSSGRRHLVVALPETARGPVSAAAAEPVGSFRELLDRIGVIELEVADAVMLNVNRPADLDARPGTDGGASLPRR